MKNSGLPPLPARFAIRKGETFWKCGVVCCEGRLATVIPFLVGGHEPGEPGYDGPFLWLPDKFDQRGDGSYAKTKSSACRSEVSKYAISNARRWAGPKPVAVLQTDGTDRSVYESIESCGRHYEARKIINRARRREQHRTFVLNQQELQAVAPLRVHCPGCGRLAIINSVTGQRQ